MLNRPQSARRSSDAVASPSVAIGRFPVAVVDHTTLMLAGVLIATLVVYLRSLNNGFVWDDNGLIVKNASLGQWSFFWKSLTRHEYWFWDQANQARVPRYRPLLLIWFGLNYRLFGLNPAAWHASGLMLHLAGVWMVFKIAARLTGRAAAAMWAALFFGLLPAHAEAIAWSASAGVPISGVCMLAAFNFYLRPAGAGRRLLAPGFFALAMLSHESAAAFPGLIGLHSFLLEPGSTGAAPENDAVAGQVGARLHRALLRMLPFLGVLALYFAARRYALGFFMSNPDIPFNDATTAQVLMTIPWVVSAYLIAMTLPQARFFHNRVLFVTSAASPHFYLPLAALVVLSAAFLIAIRSHPRRRLYLFCAGWTAIALMPMIDLFGLPPDSLSPNGYTYLASVGWCLLAGDWLAGLGRAAPSLRIAAQTAGFALAAGYALALWKTEYLFHDDFTLLTRCVQAFPEQFHCRDLLAKQLEARNDPTGAERELNAALAVQPADPVAWFEKGRLDQSRGRTGPAEEEMWTGLGMMRKTAPPEGYIRSRRALRCRRRPGARRSRPRPCTSAARRRGGGANDPREVAHEAWRRGRSRAEPARVDGRRSG